MNTLEAEEGQLCLVYEDLSESIDWTAETLSYTIPEKIVVPSNLTRISATVKSSDSSALMFSVSYISDRWSGIIRYTDASGTSTQTSVSKVEIDGDMMTVYFSTVRLIGTTITLTSSTVTDSSKVLPYIGKIGSTHFKGVYQRMGTNWVTIDTGLTAQAGDVLSGTFYSGRTIKEGTFNSDQTTAGLAKKLDIIKSINAAYDSYIDLRPLRTMIAEGSDSLNTLHFARMIKVTMDVNTNGRMFENFGVNSTFEIPENFTYDLPGWDMNDTGCTGMFYNFLKGNESARVNFKKLDLSSLKSPGTGCYQMFSNANAGKEIDFSSLGAGAYMNETFMDNTMVEKIDLRNVTTIKDTAGSLTLSKTFSGCTSLRHLDIRNMEIPEDIFIGFHTFDGVPTDCEIIVKDDSMRNLIKRDYPNFTNIKTIAEYKAD
jgi:hypothetical protein